MNFTESLTNAVNGAISLLDRNKDKILLGTGLMLGLGSTVSAGFAAVKAKKTMDIRKDTLKVIEIHCDIDPEYKDSDEYKKDILRTNFVAVKEATKGFVITAGLAAGAGACIIGQHCVMQRRVDDLTKTVAGLSAAYLTIDTIFKKYRKNVVDELGVEADKRFRYGIKKEKVELIEKQEDGKEKKVKKEIQVVDDLEYSDYAKFFDCTSNQFRWKDALKTRPDWEDNLVFLNCTLSVVNQKLQKQGYLFLNDVYEELGLPKTKAGQVVGWIYDPEDSTIDSHISFGTYQVINRRAVNCDEYEECMLLDFNVDGVIIDKIDAGDK